MELENNKVTNLPNVKRVEVIDHNGRAYTNKDPRNHVQVSLQDDGRTLKVFITKMELGPGLY